MPWLLNQNELKGKIRMKINVIHFGLVLTALLVNQAANASSLKCTASVSYLETLTQTKSIKLKGALPFLEIKIQQYIFHASVLDEVEDSGRINHIILGKNGSRAQVMMLPGESLFMIDGSNHLEMKCTKR